jgi:hypothetical protein
MNVKENISYKCLDVKMIFRRNVMYRCEKNDCKEIYLFGEKHKQSFKKRTAGEIVIKFQIDGIRRIWYENGKTIDTNIVEKEGNIIRRYEISSLGFLVSRMNALLNEVKRLVEGKKWKETETIFTGMEEEIYTRINIANWHISEKIIKKRLQCLKEFGWNDDVENLREK